MAFEFENIKVVLGQIWLVIPYKSICRGNFSFYCIVKEFVGVYMYIVYKHLNMNVGPS